MMASASSADFRCCTSKSGGTYSASITGVSGSTLTSRMLPFDWFAIMMAAAMAGLASAPSVRSIGTRIFLYMAPSLSLSRSPVAACAGRSADRLHAIGLRERARGDEALEPSCMRMQFAPALDGKIDHDETGGR